MKSNNTHKQLKPCHSGSIAKKRPAPHSKNDNSIALCAMVIQYLKNVNEFEFP